MITQKRRRPASARACVVRSADGAAMFVGGGSGLSAALRWGLLAALLKPSCANSQTAGSSRFDHAVAFSTAKEVDGLLGDVWTITDVQATAIGDRLLYNGSVDAAAMRRLLFAQQKAADSSVFMMYTCFTDGEWFGYYNNGSSVAGYAYTYAAGNRSFMPAASYDPACSALCNGSKWCRCKWYADPITGEPGELYAGPLYFPSKERSWYVAAVEHGKGWTSVYPFSSGGLGITAYKRFSESGKMNGNMVGVIAIDYRFDGISTILESGTATYENHELVLYIAETNADASGYLIGTSLGSLDYLTSAPKERVLAVDCDHTAIYSAARFLDKKRSVGIDVKNQLYIHNHHFIMSSPVGVSEGIEWEMVTIQHVSCLEGYFEDAENALCSRCVAPSTSHSGATSCNVCYDGYVQVSGRCEPCPDGATCTNSSLIVKPGWWRSYRSTTVHKCRDPEHCAGGSSYGERLCAKGKVLRLCHASHSLNPNLLSVVAGLPGFVGPLCSTCDTNYFSSWSRTKCEKCSNRNNHTPAIGIAVVAALILAAGLVIKRQRLQSTGFYQFIFLMKQAGEDKLVILLYMLQV